MDEFFANARKPDREAYMLYRSPRPLEYTWYPMATGFIRNTLKANRCDVVMGYAQGHELVLNTNHYMTSAFTIVVPGDSDLAGVTELSDPALKEKHIGIIAGSPPPTILPKQDMSGAMP